MSWTDERKDIVKKMWLGGATAREIVAKLGGGISRSAVIGAVHRMGLPKRDRPAAKQSVVRRQPVVRPTPRPPRPAPLPISPADEVVVPSVHLGGKPGNLPTRNVWAPLPGSTPVPFGDRRLEQCKWPIGDGLLSCGCKVEREGYCADHALIAFKGAPKPNLKIARRYA